ncbi:EscU/YscU/HrcU family type III secretion system export apparatus switch protein [Rhodophyticola sp. CCM32]|uniref:EscU/YscU/HrcU family type III secretion system export apparatus switch protein n=1 Tax=Rhodophyticola sp. CCM32 TaxID=2916397 RepID=UPI003082F44C
MSEDQASGDKPFDPTPKKLEEARRKGEIVRSTDLNTAVIYGGMLLGAALFGQAVGTDLGDLAQGVFAQADSLATLILSPGGQSLSAGMIRIVMIGFLTLIAPPPPCCSYRFLPNRRLCSRPRNWRQNCRGYLRCPMQRTNWGRVACSNSRNPAPNW